MNTARIESANLATQTMMLAMKATTTIIETEARIAEKASHPGGPPRVERSLSLMSSG
jgi:hypothetical protein